MPPNPEVFTYRASQAGQVFIRWHGQTVKILQGAAAQKFLHQVQGADAPTVQLVMAKITGNFKRGNEKRARAGVR